MIRGDGSESNGFKYGGYLMVIVFCDGIKRMLDVSTVHRSPLFWFHCMTRERVRWGDDDVIVSLALCSESKWNESSTLHYAMLHFSSNYNTSTLQFLFAITTETGDLYCSFLNVCIAFDFVNLILL